MLKVAKTKTFRDHFTGFVRDLEREGKSGSYTVRFKKVLASWFAYNNIDVKLKVNIIGEYDTPTLENERMPTRKN
jgi:hypothetical protein